MEEKKGLKMNKIHCGDALELAKQLDDETIDCIVTSPPYWALRDYQIKGQIGREDSFDDYIKKLCDLFDVLKQKLKKTGTVWINLGDTFGGTGDKGDCVDPKYVKGRTGQKKAINKTVLQKSLCAIPLRFVTEMINHGWLLRNVIIWHKPNCMPSSANDRFTVDFEYVFFFVKNKKYFFEQQLEPYTKPMNRWGGDKLKADGKSIWDKGTGQDTYRTRNMRPNSKGRNMRCVWSIPTKPFKDAHFATYPEALIEPMIKAGCPMNGVVLDPCMGAGTTALVALKQNKKFIGIELNQKYVDLANKRLRPFLTQTQLIHNES